jgi:hypothetical protein
MSGGRKIMLATKALHKSGNISRDEPDLCIVHSETPHYYVGSWVTGFGFFDVWFPKETTRELTDGEKLAMDGKQVFVLNGGTLFIDADYERPLGLLAEDPSGAQGVTQ